MSKTNTELAALVQRIPVGRIRRLPTARPLDEDNVKSLVASCKRWGLLQPVGVAIDGDDYLLFIGNHRLEAIRRLGHTEIDAIVLSERCGHEELLTQSMHENHIRKSESLEDTLQRTKALADYHKCSLSAAAKHGGVSPSKLSKIQKTLDTLSNTALDFVRKNKVGIAIAYEVARLAKNEQQQLEWLHAHAEGQMTREQIKQAAAQGTKSKPRKLRIELTLDNIGMKLSVPASLDYAALTEAISALRNRIVLQQKRELAFHLLPEVLK